jgi:hypothetical protein
MGNCKDTSGAMSLSDIFNVLRGERYYQLRRWGYRRSDDSLIEAPHSVADFVVYMLDYTNDVVHGVSRTEGLDDALEALRKVVCLGLACLEQHDRYDRDRLVTLDDIFETYRRSGRIVPLTLFPDFNNYLLKVRFFLADAEKYAACFNKDMAILAVREMVHVGIECFEQYGVTPRVHQEPVFGRDGRPT